MPWPLSFAIAVVFAPRHRLQCTLLHCFGLCNHPLSDKDVYHLQERSISDLSRSVTEIQRPAGRQVLEGFLAPPTRLWTIGTSTTTRKRCSSNTHQTESDSSLEAVIHWATMDRLRKWGIEKGSFEPYPPPPDPKICHVETQQRGLEKDHDSGRSPGRP